MSTIAEVWPEIERLLDSGLSIIPVRDKKEGDFLPKTPYFKWKEYQTRIIDKAELLHDMDIRDTAAIAIVAGSISGNLEIIDIDVKYNVGIAAVLFKDLHDLFPQLFSILPINKTPSGGYHILYRISNPPNGIVPGNQKLAGRETTDEEKLQYRKANPSAKRDLHEVNFIETRGEGGYALAPPSLGYTIHQENEIPTISWEERCDIINICKAYSQIVKIAPTFKTTQSESNYYSENPFEDFNKRCDAVRLIEEFGWKALQKASNTFVWFTRPGKDHGVSASYNKVKGVFYIFTSSTELDPEKGYLPSTLLAELKFRGDKKETYQHLVRNGYGKVKAKVEKSIVRARALKQEPIPANFSDEARLDYASTINQLLEDYPFGIFWKEEYDNNGKLKINISREGIYSVSNGLGFRLHNSYLYQIRGSFIYEMTERAWIDYLKSYIKEEDANMYEEICNAFESFMQRSAKFTQERLEELDTTNIIKDSREECNKFYQNGYVTITKDNISFNKYDELEGLIYANRIQNRDYNKGEGGLFIDYLKLATRFDEYLKSVIGFYAHEYKDSSTGYFPVLTEACEDPSQGGGSGKNVFCEMLKYTTSYIGRAASQSKLDNSIFQVWNGQRVFGISDIPDGFDFAFFKEPVTGTGVLKKLFKDERILDVEEMPKLIGQTNFSVVCTDGGMKRRIRIVEFSDFFTKCGGVDVHFGGKLFPQDFEQSDWAGYDNLVHECVQIYLKNGRKIGTEELSVGGWMKRFKIQYGPVATNFVLSIWDRLTESKQMLNSEFKTILQTYYEENDIPLSRRPQKTKIISALDEYAKKEGYEVHSNKPIRKNPYEVEKGRILIPIDPPF